MPHNIRFAAFLFAIVGVAGLTQRTAAPRGAPPGQPTVDVAAALKTVAPDLDARLARFKPVRMPYNASTLSARERQMIDQLVIALHQLEDIFWRQSDPDGLALCKALERVDMPVARSTRRYLFINGSRWDLVNENEPFVGKQPMPPGHALYPADLTRAQVDAYVAAHPDRKALIFDPYTIVPLLQKSFDCARTRSSQTTTTRATSHGSICRTRSSTSSTRRTKRISTTFWA